MDSEIHYTRAGRPRTVKIRTRRVPNMVAVKFTVVAQEIAEQDSVPPLDDHLFLDELLKQLDITIVDVVPVARARR